MLVYCVRCKKKTENDGEPQDSASKTGKLITRLKCADCGKPKITFGKRPEIVMENKPQEVTTQVGGCACQEEMDGEGLREIIERVKAFFKGPRSYYSPPIRALFEKVADKNIVSMQICRSPVQSTIQKIIDFVSLRNTPYDRLFHLYGLMKLENGEIYRFEKNQVINIAKASSEKDADCLPVEMPKPILFGQFFMKAQEYMGNKYFMYDGFENNCQDYILACLKSNGLLNSELSSFIKQDVQKLVPTFLEKIGKKVTDLAGAADTLIHGEGQMGYGLVSTPNGMIQMGFNKY